MASAQIALNVPPVVTPWSLWVRIVRFLVSGQAPAQGWLLRWSQLGERGVIVTYVVAIYIYPGVEVLDFAGPYEVFTTANRGIRPSIPR